MYGIFAAAFSYVAALMGAGFASGQEVVTFFSVFGKYGVIGIAAASVVIAFFGGIVSEIALKKDIGYNEIISEIFSEKTARAVKMLIFVYSVIVMAVMEACFGEMCALFYGLPNFAGALLLGGVCMILLIKGASATLKFNGAVGAVLFIAAASVCLFLLGYREHQTFSGLSMAINSTVSGSVYAGYNLITVGVVLANGRMFLKNKNEGILCGAAGGAMIFVLLILMWGIIGIYYGKTDLGEIPMLTLTLRESRYLAYGYSLIMAAAILTTAISSGMCAAEYMENKIGRVKGICLVVGVGIALSGAGFSTLIDRLYRYSGYVGIAAAFAVILKLTKMIIYDNRK